ncbi:MAG: ribonuclease H-like domain-containing protein [Clostridia bacterium]|nr:ribonuclease H-like domain-containing protein [Clostridia bacterium]
MYLDLKSKLEMYKTAQKAKPEPLKGNGQDIHDLMNGTVCSNDDGEYFLIENRYPALYIHGGYNLGEALNINLSSLKRVCSGLGDDSKLEDFLFLDTETTGLSSGAGTVAFLIGAGYFKDDTFILRQYFMRDYNEEPAVLRDLNSLMEGRKGFVTFNGKSFDWNILQTRFTFNRIRPVIKQPVHIDLLFPARRIWKEKLLSCRLISLEENILGETRVDDIPGAMIPGIYFKYLDDRNAEVVKKIIKHNELDILSMISLLVKITSIIESPLSESDGEYELLGVGKIFESSGESGTVMDCYETCLKAGSKVVKEVASRRLINVYKRNKNYGKVIEHCENILAESKGPNISVMIEMAKHYEHRDKNIQRAIEIVEEAINLSSRMGFRNNIYYPELKKRLERLKRKAK